MIISFNNANLKYYIDNLKEAYNNIDESLDSIKLGIFLQTLLECESIMSLYQNKDIKLLSKEEINFINSYNEFIMNLKLENSKITKYILNVSEIILNKDDE